MKRLHLKTICRVTGDVHRAAGANNLWLFKTTVIKVKEKNVYVQCFNNESNYGKLTVIV